MHGGSIGTRGEVLSGNGETITTVRYTVSVSKVTGMEFTTSTGTTFGPFGWDKGNEIVVKVSPAIVCFFFNYKNGSPFCDSINTAFRTQFW